VEWAAGFKPNQGKKAYGIGYEEEKAGTLLSGQVGGVLVKMSYQKTTGPLMANSHPGSYSGQDVYSDMLITERGGGENMDICNAEIRQLQGNGSSVNNECETVQVGNGSGSYYAARRLTPTECARLQGFPDDWAADVPHTDSAEYKMWGNGIALPCLLPMMKAMRDILMK